MRKIRPFEDYSGMTMTVEELIKTLTLYPKDLSVIAIWEGVEAGIREENIKMVKEPGKFPQLEINVEDYG